MIHDTRVAQSGELGELAGELALRARRRKPAPGSGVAVRVAVLLVVVGTAAVVAGVVVVVIGVVIVIARPAATGAGRSRPSAAAVVARPALCCCRPVEVDVVVAVAGDGLLQRTTCLLSPIYPAGRYTNLRALVLTSTWVLPERKTKKKFPVRDSNPGLMGESHVS
jgi:hypothetical protein